ncbi:GNAT family N-acetyltransferase [Kibdelosporangium persicum]|uniref:Aminoalkylphosphonic acid N-acetyltransferase n=1 Tax=Kibdelosporangium persicum TaxID=2698649 RepID=A0ABX2F368_9PSEU|nr:GNAT family N-acetyltransferase [Kibdelosporangium persicum]NRN65643.1 Aminoalkylphosphonic acid N-acetyltransferase [Kibdelosporangium persicum]
MNVKELDDSMTGQAFRVMRELRPHLTGSAEFAERIRRQRAEGYRLVGSFDASGDVVSVAGFRTGNNLAWGHFLYVDDLCTLPEARGHGHASALLQWIDEEARRLGCQQVHLDSGTHRHDAHRRYLSSGYVIQAFHFGKPA